MAEQSRLRIGRVSISGQVYHITTTTYGRAPLFADPIAARPVIAVMRQMHDTGWLRSHAWVLMPDHLHWLLTLGGQAPLSATINRFKSASSHAVKRIGCPGCDPVWQTGYHDHALRRDEDLRTIARYIVANPIRAGLCRSVGEYPWWDAEWL